MRRTYTPCEPACSVVKKFGGAAATAEVAECTESQVYRWMRPVGASGGGLGGCIPRWYHQKLLDAAKAKDIPLALSEFYPSQADAA